MISAFFLALIQIVPNPIDNVPPDCSYDIDAMAELDRNAFDQDMDGGWRILGQTNGCELAAAELIREWRHTKRDHAPILYWHEGQMRAYAGQTDEAIALFRLTYSAPEFDENFGWNHYVSGTIAFLKGDEESLDSAIERLKAVPEPLNNSFTRPDGTEVKMSWPPNLNVLEGFKQCWGKPYRVAYGGECAKPVAIDR